MKLPTIKGVIDRRILANYRVNPEVVQNLLPEPFEAKLFRGFAIAGICMIRLKSVRPKCSIPFLAIDSENAAHRFAVKWKVDGVYQEGVYIPRRDTSSSINAMAGGKIFPGVHHKAKFEVEENEKSYSVRMSHDDGTRVEVAGSISVKFPDDSIFESMDESSQFFEKGCLGYSDTSCDGRFDGLELRIFNWEVQNLKVESIYSSYFEDDARFPKGSVVFDHALLMRNLEHEWDSREEINLFDYIVSNFLNIRIDLICVADPRRCLTSSLLKQGLEN